MQKRTKSHDTPLAEITLRKYEAPENLEKREAIRKICLSVGLLQPGDSRDIVVDIFHVLVDSDMAIDCDQIQNFVIKNRKDHNLPLVGVAQSNIRRQLRRLRELFFVEKMKNKYRITENEKLINIFEEKIEKYYMKAVVGRVKDYFNYLEQKHPQNRVLK